MAQSKATCVKFAKTCLAAALTLGAMTALAATRKGWKGSDDRYWTTIDNWKDISQKTDGYFLRGGEGTTLDDTKRTIRFKQSTPISVKVSVESASTSASHPYSFLADADGYGLTTSANFDVGTWEAGHLAVKRGTYQCNQLNVGGGDGTSGDVVVIGGNGNNATVTATGKVAINKDTVRVKAKGKLICQYWAAAGNTDNNTGTLVIDGGEVQHNTANYLTIGDTAKATGYVYVKNGGKYSNTGSNAIGLCVGQKNVGTLDVDNGTVDIGTKKLMLCDNTSGKATVNVKNGAVVTMGCVAYGTGTGGATMTIDGGTIKAAQSSAEFMPAIDKLNVYVGDNGATFDTARYTITIGENLQNASGKTGSARFTGGGVATLAAAPGYTGRTMVEIGTILHVPSPDGIGGGLAVSTPDVKPAVGTYTLLVCDGEDVFTNDMLTGIPVPAGATLSLSQDGKSVLCAWDGGAIWVGGTSGSLSYAANWANNAVPGPGTNCIIGVSADATLTVGDAFAASSITFPLESAAVTINASGSESIAGIEAITNLSQTVSHTFNVPVHFIGDIQVKQEAMAETGDLAKAHVTFAGGAYAAPGHALENGDFAAVYSRCVFGRYYLASTAENRWSVLYQSNGKRICLSDGSYLYVPYAGQLNELYVETGAKVYVGDMDLDGRFIYKNYGEVSVTNMTVTGSADIFMSYNQGTDTPGVFKIESMSNALSGKWFYLGDAHAASAHEFYIGAGGMNFTSDTTCYCLGNSIGAGNVCIIRPWHSDFAIADGGGEYNVVFAYGATLCTDDEDGTGRVITIASATRADASPVVVSGSGTLKVSKPCVNAAEPQVSVTGTATLEYATGASLGTGALSLGAGTTFVVSSADLPVNVASLALPETGAATIRIVGDSALPDGEYALFASASLLPAGFESKINLVLPDGSSAARRLYTADGGTLRFMLGDGTLPCVWTGAADDGNKMNTPGNWLAGTVPPAGATVFIPSAAGTLDNDIVGFAPASVTFGYGDGAVTIGGNAIAGVAAITNLSSSTHVINVPVAFEDKIFVVQGAMSWEQKSNPSIRFAGGVTGTTFADGTARYLNGLFTLTTGEGWIANTQGSNNRWGIPAGSWLTLPEATDTCELTLGDSSTAGGAFTTGVLRTSARLLCWNYGEYVVTNEFEAVFPGDEIHFCGYDGISNGKFKFEKLILSGGSGTNPILKLGNGYSSTGDTGTQRFYIGNGGLCFADEAHQNLRFESGGAKNNATVRIDPWHGDYTIHKKANASSTRDFTVSTVTYFGTTDENGNACTVTDNGVISSYGDAAQIHIDGKGTFVVNAVGTAACPVTVEGSATLAINAGKKLTTGATTVNSGATLEVAESGTVSLGGNLTLQEGATLKFNFTERDTAPVLDLTDKTVTVGGQELEVSLTGTRPAYGTDGKYALTSGGKFVGKTAAKSDDCAEWVRNVGVANGDIYAEIANNGLVVIVN